MIDRSRAAALAAITLLVLAVAACGQMGPLTLPAETPADEDEQGDDDEQ